MANAYNYFLNNQGAAGLMLSGATPQQLQLTENAPPSLDMETPSPGANRTDPPALPALPIGIGQYHEGAGIAAAFDATNTAAAAVEASVVAKTEASWTVSEM
jgi:hypothetical protein